MLCRNCRSLARQRPLAIEPDLSQVEEIPFYAKLRAEAEPEVLEKGSGKLYLGFHLDPLYEVHWNNEVGGQGQDRC